MKKNDQTNYVRYGELNRIKGITTVIKADVAGKQNTLTPAQMAAVDSGITAEILSKLLDGLFTVTEYQSGKWALKVNILAKDADGVQHPIDGLFTDGFLSAGGFSSGGGGGGGDIVAAYFNGQRIDADGLIKFGIKVNGTWAQIQSDATYGKYVNIVASGGGSDVSWGTAGADTQVLTVDGVSKTLLTGHQSLSAYRTAANQDTIDNAIKARLGDTTSSNPAADKDFVNSSIATSTATFRGTSASGLTEAQFLSWANGLAKDDNDYVFWNTVDSAGNTQYKRYKYNGSSWVFEYTLNNSSFTAAQWAAIGSGITSSLVTKLNGIASGAQVNVLEKVKLNGSELTITSKAVNVNAATSLTMPTGLSAAALTSAGNIAVSFQNGYSIPTTSKQTSWDTGLNTLASLKAWIESLIGVDDNGDVYIKPNGTTPRNFYSYGNVSAGGIGTGGGGGGSIVTWNQLATAGTKIATISIDGVSTDVYAPATATWGNISGKPSWIGDSKPSYAFSEITGTASESQIPDISSTYLTRSRFNVLSKQSGSSLATCDDLIGTCGIFRMGSKAQSETPDTGGYGNLLSMFVSGADTYAQIYLGYSNDASRNIFFRSGRSDLTSATHRTWHHVLHDGNFVAGTDYLTPSGTAANASKLENHPASYFAGISLGNIFTNDNFFSQKIYVGGTTSSPYLSGGAASSLIVHGANGVVVENSGSGTYGLTVNTAAYFDRTATVAGAIKTTDSLTITKNTAKVRLETASAPSNYYLDISIAYAAAHSISIVGTYNTELFGMYQSHLCAIPSTSGANFGIGTTAPSYKLHVNGTAGFSDNVTLLTNQKALNVTIESTAIAAISTTASALMFGRGTSAAGISSYFYGDNLYFKYGNNVGVGMTLANTGRVGVGLGNVTPGTTLDVLSSDFYAVSIRRNNANNGAMIRFENTNTSTPKLAAFGYYKSTGINEFRWYHYTAAQGTETIATLTSTGNFIAIGQVTAGAASDLRFKKNIESITRVKAESILAGLRPVEFDWNELGTELSGNKGHDTGLIAQEVLGVFPYAVSPIYERYMRVDYAKLTPILVAGWQSHEMRIANLERENEMLKEEIKRLRA